MREYIVNLTNNLIGKHGFDLMFASMKARAKSADWKEDFVRWVNITIGSRDVRDMSPETLGKVMCSLEEMELPCYEPASFLGKPDQYLRNIVSSFLAWSIRYRLDEEALKRHDTIPPYTGKKANPSTARQVINRVTSRIPLSSLADEDVIKKMPRAQLCSVFRHLTGREIDPKTSDQELRVMIGVSARIKMLSSAIGTQLNTDAKSGSKDWE